MTATPQTEFESRIGTLEAAIEDDEIGEADHDAIRAFVATYDPSNLMETPPEDASTLSVGTLNVYLSRLTEAARHFTLTDADIEDVNGFLQTLKDRGRVEETINGYSTALRQFFGFYDSPIDPANIATVSGSNGASFDPDDVLTREEIQEMLDAAEYPRDRAIFALLIYTGMRNHALRTLRVGDIDLENDRWQFNEEHEEGLKGAHETGQKRPLLGAKHAVREWLSYHPAPDDPDAYLITGLPKYGQADPYNPVDGSTVRRALQRMAENTDNPAIQDKPVHPHMMRHNFVTICKRDYELPDETVKFLIGHVKGSKVMETTYSHLSDEDDDLRAEIASGEREELPEDSPLTPTLCPTCGESLDPQAKACPMCATVFTPGAKQTIDEIDADMKEDYRETDPRDEGTMDQLDKLDEILEDPEVKALIAEKFQNV